jgi:hypothetical protein
MEWEPSGEVEAAMLAALEAGDGASYVRLLSSAPLYRPVVPAGDDGPWPASLPRPTPDLVLLFTSPAAFDRVLGGVVERSEQVNLADLRETHPPHARLVVDPGLPIVASVRLDEVDGSGGGVRSGGLEDAVIDDALAEIRGRCLAELGGDARALARLEPVNALEDQLRAARSATDFEGFLQTLALATVVLPLRRPVDAGDRVGDPGFPWLVLGAAATPMIPVFSSERMLDTAAPAGLPRVTVAFRDVVRGWPASAHVLCFAPGTGLELTLPAETVGELAAALGDQAPQARDTGPAEPAAATRGAEQPADDVEARGSRAAPAWARAVFLPLVFLAIVLVGGEAGLYAGAGACGLVAFALFALRMRADAGGALAIGALVAATAVAWQVTRSAATVVGVVLVLVVAGLVVAFTVAARRSARRRT